jgi:hypothetical protein
VLLQSGKSIAPPRPALTRAFQKRSSYDDLFFDVRSREAAACASNCRELIQYHFKPQEQSLYRKNGIADHHASPVPHGLKKISA